VSRSFRYTREKLGTVTPLVAPGQSATLRLTLDRGTFTYVCTVPGHAAAGIKGSLTVQ
jgi:uncharacterized cupredoxin-like copper-binding protein